MRALTTFTAACVLAAGSPARADKLDDIPLVRALRDELARTTSKLELPGVGKLYFASYALWDGRRASVSATFGSLTHSQATPRRFVDIDLRVGDYALDNSNFGDGFGQRRSVTLPDDDDYDAVRRELWLASDGAYKHAGEQLDRKQAVLKQETKTGDEAPSMSRDTPANVVDIAPIATPELAPLEALAKKLSAVFRTNKDAYTGTVSIVSSVGNRYFVSSEGALAGEHGSEIRVSVQCSTQADDGTSISSSLVFAAKSFDKLPREADMLAQVEQLSRELSETRAAPMVEDYAGPVLFRGMAAAQLVRALLAENLSGTPAPKGDHPGMRSIGESELVGKIGQRILPPGFSVVDDPTGVYAFDDEGIAPHKVTLVDSGTLKTFLMSRTPRKGFEHSTGHARSSAMSAVRAHPANLVMSTTKGLSDRELLARALAAAKEQGLAYVIVVDKLGVGDPADYDPSTFSGGGSIVPLPVVMKRVYLDGHEQRLRGGSFGALQLRTLKDLLAAGATGTVYHYVTSGANRRFDAMFESPTGFGVTITAPGLLFRDIDVKKPIGPHRKPPIAPRP
jgi:hypothetical protein